MHTSEQQARNAAEAGRGPSMRDVPIEVLIGHAAKRWHVLERKHPTIPVETTHNDQELSDALSSYHANGKHEAMLELFRLLNVGGYLTDMEMDTSYIEETCVEFDHVDVAVCNQESLCHYVRVHFDGTVEVL